LNVLLLSMPDSFEHMPPVAIRMPNGALTSLAANVDPHHRVAVADLILVQSSVRATVAHLVREFEPDVVGLSVMTFQLATAMSIARLESSAAATIRASRPTRTTRSPRSISSFAAKASRRSASCCGRSRMRDRAARSLHPLSEGCRTGRPPASCTGPIAP